MNKTFLIIKREYLSRVRKKSFIYMTLLVPVLFAVFIIAAISLMFQEKEKHNVEVIDESTAFVGELKSTNDIHFFFNEISIEQAKAGFYSSPYDIILYVPYKEGEHDILKLGRAQLFFKKQPGILLQEVIKKQMENILYDYQLKQYGIDQKKVEEARKFSLGLAMVKIDEKGNEENSNSDLLYVIGFGGGLLIYMFILLYGVQVMRGVIEEKSNRIIEVIISSVKPFQLMMGKIIGVAMVGLTQFLMWVVLSAILISVGQATFLKKYADDLIPSAQQEIMFKPGMNMTEFKKAKEEISSKQIAEALGALTNKKFMATLILCFLFYFLGGYLLYSSLFAAFGAAVDNETETQQFMLPVTLPLVLAYVISIFIMQNPNSSVAFWFSIVPFTSPVVMMARLPFGVHAWELALSMSLLIAAFIFITWLAGKIYRTGILMYGKKVTYKELWKWLRYSG